VILRRLDVDSCPKFSMFYIESLSERRSKEVEELFGFSRVERQRRVYLELADCRRSKKEGLGLAKHCAGAGLVATA
jgi:hypothetical protein